LSAFSFNRRTRSGVPPPPRGSVDAGGGSGTQRRVALCALCSSVRATRKHARKRCKQPTTHICSCLVLLGADARALALRLQRCRLLPAAACACVQAAVDICTPHCSLVQAHRKPAALTAQRKRPAAHARTAPPASMRTPARSQQQPAHRRREQSNTAAFRVSCASRT
jgi:hypothetical protein